MRDYDQREEHGMREDPLRTARGIAWGVAIGTVLWGVIIGIFMLWIIR